MRKHLLLLLILTLVCSACGNISADAPVKHTEIAAPTEDPWPGLSWEEEQTLASLEKVADFPVYTMHFTGGYTSPAAVGEFSSPAGLSGSSWACTLFAVLADEDNNLFGRNFDWEYSPVLVLYTDPPDGYASVSIVDLAYSGFTAREIPRLDELPLDERTSLLNAPLMPFDGMNEHGLAIGMAAVPSGNMIDDPEKPTIDSLEVMRIVLDQARTVGEAEEIFEQYNLDMGSGPDLHYLIADRNGDAILIEFLRGEMVVIPNSAPWHLSTNFLCSAVSGGLEGNCWRYDTVLGAFTESGGNLSPAAGMDLLEAVSQDNTQWSVIYGISSGRIDLAVGREYAKVYSFDFDLIGE